MQWWPLFCIDSLIQYADVIYGDERLVFDETQKMLTFSRPKEIGQLQNIQK